MISNLEGLDSINTYFLTERDIQSSGKTKIEKLNLHRKASKDTHHYLTATEECILRGQAVIRKLIGLEERGISIDIIICHGGMGYGLFIKDYRPSSIVISYNEWFLLSKTQSIIFKLHF